MYIIHHGTLGIIHEVNIFPNILTKSFHKENLKLLSTIETILGQKSSEDVRWTS
jgi:hypothetical protein